VRGHTPARHHPPAAAPVSESELIHRTAMRTVPNVPVLFGAFPVEAARLPPLSQGVFSTLVVTSLYAVLSCLFVFMVLWIIRRGPGAPLLPTSWWLTDTPAPAT
jgi:hypothetical protein